MFAFEIKTPTLTVPAHLLTKEIMMKGANTVVNNYRERLARGKGVTPAGAIVKLQKLSDITKANKGSNIPLVDKGLMRAAFRVDPSLTTDRKAVMNFPSTEAWKAGIHQKGLTIKPKRSGGVLAIPYGGKTVFAKSVTIPARPHVGFSMKDKRDAIKMLRGYTVERAKRKIEIGRPK